MFVRSDAGRYVEGYKHEKNDCVVRAIAHAYDLPYNHAHATIKSLGRQDRKGFHTPKAMEVHKYQYKQDLPHMTVKTFLRQFPRGVYVLRIRGHAFAVKNGVIYDTFQPKLGSHIRQFWKVK